jgi:hypothetical protein
MARRVAATGHAIVLTATGGGTGWWLSHQRHAGASAAPPVSTATATVVRTDLATTTPFGGTLGYADARPVVAQARGGTVTALPAPGQVIARGQPVYEVDGTPVRLFYGSRPSWRALDAGAGAGPDVAELEQNLVALGYAGFPPDDAFTAATAAAVRRWQRATGQPVTGRVELGALAYRPGPIRVATVTAHPGSPVAPGVPVLTATSTTVVVTVPVPAGQTYLVHVGDAVTVTLPSGTTTPGRVASISGVATGGPPDPQQGPPQGPQQATVPAVVALTAPAAAGLDQAPVTVTVTGQTVRDALAVPVTALVALAGGGYGVYRRDGAGRRLVAVSPGIFANTLVEVRGDALRAGDTVEVPAG